jgi:ubiquinone/menaquinone biosynthesis C-methylase UbiE
LATEQESKVISFCRKTASKYDKEYANPYFQEVYDKITWHYIKPSIPKTGIILDAGGGTGKWSVP